ncbi:heavy metal translocating P-type ATPase [Oceanibacterium hippocampi]|uniref:Copper-exporting P-type ATPase A n=1 Tax=Oceanibacterium hippocampi TaxID=745714 RepID=A0A1Y5SAL2_9PROT|nr:heavy metal translocating P-type ATPase [Oceanibacterium hippocampi]SLN36283.1 Copper-exporting P-type ATPase A [Oceanibacterium hippocampi]
MTGTASSPGTQTTDDHVSVGGGANSADEIRLASRDIGAGLRQNDLSVPDMHCGGCIRKVEQALNALDGVERARVNLTEKRVSVAWRDTAGPPPLFDALGRIGFRAHLADDGARRADPELTKLLRALAVAGFAAGNIMLLSVSVWSGADAALRDLFHWISAAIALPVLLYSGRVFFRPAWQAVRRGHANMDVPISIGVILAYLMSLYDTVGQQQHVYFDAAVTLLFVLLIGRTLDHLMRQRARSAITGLARLGARGAMVVQDDGSRAYRPVAEIRPGMTILLAMGERVPVDAVVVSGTSDIDRSLVSGESAPAAVAGGDVLEAGTLNLTAPLTIRATAEAGQSFLAEMVRLIDVAEAGRAGYRRIADRAAALYAPVVHSAAFATFLAWLYIAGDIHRALTVAIAVLIITCPCALGLAVPIVQVVAARRLFERGILVKDSAAMERLAGIDTVIFDKTGTLTLGAPRLDDRAGRDPAHVALAVALAAQSRHPYSRALVARFGADPASASAFEAVAEHPGCGIEARQGADVIRLGRPDWAAPGAALADEGDGRSRTVLARNGRLLESFAFGDPLRPGVAQAIARLRARGIEIEIMSGDRREAVARLAEGLGVTAFSADVRPADKAARVAELSAAGRKVLMVGDGLNDVPALAAADVSMSPSSGADIGRNAADFVFLHDSLETVATAIEVSRRAAALVRQNLGLAVLYNALTLPLAALGFVTPLLAALAMSSSSILVVANALRLNGGAGKRQSSAGGRTAAKAGLRPAEAAR